MEEDQIARARLRVRVLAETVGLPLAEERVPALAEAFDGTRVVIAQLEAVAARGDGPVNATFDASWVEGRKR